eukprot:203787_1
MSIIRVHFHGGACIGLIDLPLILINNLQNKNNKYEEKRATNEEQKYNVISEDSKNAGNYITEYGTTLFQYFCQNKQANWICIKQYHKLPKNLKNALLFNDKNEMSIVLLCKLFIYTETL